MQMETLLIFSPVKSNHFINKTIRNFQMAPLHATLTKKVKNIKNEKSKQCFSSLINFDVYVT